MADLIGSSAHPPVFFGFGAISKSPNSSSNELFRDGDGLSSEFPDAGLPFCLSDVAASDAAAAAAARRPFLADYNTLPQFLIYIFFELIYLFESK